METLNLSKGDLLNLSKQNSILSNINLGLGWDASVNGRELDLDVTAIMVNEDNKIFDMIYFGNLQGLGVKLNGDNRTGHGENDDEIITIDFNSISKQVKYIGVFVNIFDACGRDFSKVRNAYIRMVNNDTNEEVCRYALNENGRGFNAFHFANLEKVEGEWIFTAIGEGTNGRMLTLREYFINKVNGKKEPVSRPETLNNSSSITEQGKIKPTLRCYLARLFK